MLSAGGQTINPSYLVFRVGGPSGPNLQEAFRRLPPSGQMIARPVIYLPLTLWRKEQYPGQPKETDSLFPVCGKECCNPGGCSLIGHQRSYGSALPSTDERVSSLPLEVTASQGFAFPARDLCCVTPRWRLLGFCFFSYVPHLVHMGASIWLPRKYTYSVGCSLPGGERLCSYTEALSCFFLLFLGKIHVR